MNNKFNTKWAIVFAAGLLTLSISASAQMIIPVDQRFPPPRGFSFVGEWECNDRGVSAQLEVAGQSRSTKSNPAGPWTKLHQSEDGFVGNYLIGFDRDKGQFLMLDVDDPAVLTYRTDGWDGDRFALYSTGQQEGTSEPVRIQFEVHDSLHFSVFREKLVGNAWKADPTVTCKRLNSK